MRRDTLHIFAAFIVLFSVLVYINGTITDYYGLILKHVYVPTTAKLQGAESNPTSCPVFSIVPRRTIWRATRSAHHDYGYSYIYEVNGNTYEISFTMYCLDRTPEETKVLYFPLYPAWATGEYTDNGSLLPRIFFKTVLLLLILVMYGSLLAYERREKKFSDYLDYLRSAFNQRKHIYIAVFYPFIATVIVSFFGSHTLSLWIARLITNDFEIGFIGKLSGILLYSFVLGPSAVALCFLKIFNDTNAVSLKPF